MHTHSNEIKQKSKPYQNESNYYDSNPSFFGDVEQTYAKAIPSSDIEYREALLKKIKEEIHTLKKTYPEPYSDTQFIDRIILNYIQQVIAELEKRMDNDKQAIGVSVEALESFLKDNWNQVKGSLLGYTALPDNAITKLLCDVAKYVAAHKKEQQLKPINILMPTVACDSLLPDKYPNLDEIDLRAVITSHILSRIMLI